MINNYLKNCKTKKQCIYIFIRSQIYALTYCELKATDCVPNKKDSKRKYIDERHGNIEHF